MQRILINFSSIVAITKWNKPSYKGYKESGYKALNYAQISLVQDDYSKYSSYEGIESKSQKYRFNSLKQSHLSFNMKKR